MQSKSTITCLVSKHLHVLILKELTPAVPSLCGMQLHNHLLLLVKTFLDGRLLMCTPSLPKAAGIGTPDLDN